MVYADFVLQLSFERYKETNEQKIFHLPNRNNNFPPQYNNALNLQTAMCALDEPTGFSSQWLW